jgi:hypothetical protein
LRRVWKEYVNGYFRGPASHGMGAAAMMNQPLLASHVIVGGLLHLAMSAAAGWRSRSCWRC